MSNFLALNPSVEAPSVEAFYLLFSAAERKFDHLWAGWEPPRDLKAKSKQTHPQAKNIIMILALASSLDYERQRGDLRVIVCSSRGEFNFYEKEE